MTTKNKILIMVLMISLSANVLFLDWMWYLDMEDKKVTGLDGTSFTEEKFYQKGGSFEIDESPDLDITSEINALIKEATASLTRDVVQLQQKEGVVETKLVPKSSPVVREIYIPLGSSSSSSTEWVDIPGLEVYVVPQNVGVVQKMYFEASLRVPSGAGQGFVRLKNVTDGISLFESEITHEGTVGKLISSASIPVPYTTKLYRVQMKSSLGAQVVIDTARIKLFVYSP